MQEIPNIVWAIYVFAMGTVVGSFLNVVIYRLPRHESLITPGSRCPHCHTPIRYRDNVPILSYILLRGRCRECQSLISPRYAIVELVTGLLFLSLFLRFGLTPALPVYAVFCSALVAVFVIDLDHMIIPDAISLNFMPVGLACSIAGFIPGMDPRASFVGLVFGGAILLLPALLYELLRGVEGLGGGDVKLMAMMGTFVGPVGVVFTLMTSSLVGSLVGLLGIAFGKTGAGAPIPYGPFLVGGAVLYLFAGELAIKALFGVSPYLLWNYVYHLVVGAV